MSRIASAVRRGLREARLFGATLGLQLFGRSDRERWSDERELDADWDARAAIVAQMIPDRSTVFEFGAGRRVLERLLEGRTKYLHADLVSRGPDTIVLDLNARPLPDLTPHAAEIAVFCGVLEYVRDLRSLVQWLACNFPTCIASYELARTRRRSPRRLWESLRRGATGWVNAYNRDEFLSLFSEAGFVLDEERLWRTPSGDEPIMRFQRRR